MVATLLKLTEENKQKLDELARRTGQTADQLANEAIQRFTPTGEHDAAFQRWRDALLKMEGMWEHRSDLPDFAEIRRSMDRGLASELADVVVPYRKA